MLTLEKSETKSRRVLGFVPLFAFLGSGSFLWYSQLGDWRLSGQHQHAHACIMASSESPLAADQVGGGGRMDVVVFQNTAESLHFEHPIATS